MQKLGGALPDLGSIDRGAFFSATGYTAPAKQYAAVSEQLIGKPIELYEFRGSTEKDEEGLIKTICINMHFVIPQLNSAQWIPHVTAGGQAALKHLLPSGDERIEYQMELRSFFDGSGKEILSLAELTSTGYGSIHEETGQSHGCYHLPNHFIKIYDVLTEICGLEYRLGYEHVDREIRISDDSEHRLALLDGAGNVLKVIPDRMLRSYSFGKNGELEFAEHNLHGT